MMWQNCLFQLRCGVELSVASSIAPNGPFVYHCTTLAYTSIEGHGQRMLDAGRSNRPPGKQRKHYPH